jgi:hypothetical protein
MMMHHPSPSSHHGESTFSGVVKIAALNRWVHGILIAAIALLVLGYWGFAQQLGLQRPLVRLGLVAYGLGGGAMMLAGVLNGLVFTAMAERYAGASGDAVHATGPVLAYGWELNQALTAVGVVAWSAAVLAWSLELLRCRGAWRILGGLGVPLGAAGAVLLLTGHLRLDVHGFGGFLLAQSLWNAAVGIRLALPDRVAARGLR